MAGFEQNPDLMLVARGQDLHIVGVNQAMRRLVPGKDLIGVPLTVAWAELEGQQIFDLYERCFRTGEAEDGHEWRLVVDRGAGEPAEIFLDFGVSPWTGGDGRIVGVIGRGTDVTALVRARDEAVEQQKRAASELADAQETVLAIQDAMLPPGLPVLPQVDIGGSYILAEEGAAAGGDWFDAVALQDGRVALIAGDVVGHGIEASAVMGQLRSALVTLLLRDSDPESALTELDRFARRLPEARATTVCLAVLDPATGGLSYVTAGHPPPLLVSPDGPRFLDSSGAGVLGYGDTFEAHTASLARGDLLVIYTDGILERPGVAPARAAADLARVAFEAFTGHAPNPAGVPIAELVSSTTTEQLSRATGIRDDVTVLSARLLETPRDDLLLRLPAVEDSVRVARERVEAWLTPLHLDLASGLVVQHAVGELVTNVVLHAYAEGSPAAGGLRVHARLGEDGVLTVRVADDGRWREPDESSTYGGRGLSTTRTLVDSLQVVHGADDHGTTVTFTLRLLRTANLASAVGRPATTVPRRTHDFAVTTGRRPGTADDGPRDVVTVTGAVDVFSARSLERALVVATTSRSGAVVVDLSHVSVLSSAGVQVLTDAREQAPELTFVASPASPAQRVLDLVHLPYRAALG